jgi:hypothetical protein
MAALGLVQGRLQRRQFVVAITVAEFVYRLFDLPSSFSFMTCVACAVAMSCYFVINEISVALIISRVEQIALREVVSSREV